MTILGSDRVPYRWFVKWVGTWSPQERMVRVARLVWSRGFMTMGGYTAKVSVGLRPALFSAHSDCDGWRLTLLGVRLHYQRSYGGWLT